jgi:hypothetical protein
MVSNQDRDRDRDRDLGCDRDRDRPDAAATGVYATWSMHPGPRAASVAQCLPSEGTEGVPHQLQGPRLPVAMSQLRGGDAASGQTDRDTSLAECIGCEHASVGRTPQTLGHSTSVSAADQSVQDSGGIHARQLTDTVARGQGPTGDAVHLTDDHGAAQITQQHVEQASMQLQQTHAEALMHTGACMSATSGTLYHTAAESNALTLPQLFLGTHLGYSNAAHHSPPHDGDEIGMDTLTVKFQTAALDFSIRCEGACEDRADGAHGI